MARIIPIAPGERLDETLLQPLGINHYRLAKATDLGLCRCFALGPQEVYGWLSRDRDTRLATRLDHTVRQPCGQTDGQQVPKQPKTVQFSALSGAQRLGFSANS